MKQRILCYGDSNTWGYDAASDGRFPEEVRFTGQLQNRLGPEQFTIIEEGLCGRTTVFDDPLTEGLSGLFYLTPCLMSHSPLDLLIVMLGTNDCKARFSLTPRNIACGMRRLLRKAIQTDCWRSAPKVLLIAPGPIEPGCETSPAGTEMGICAARSAGLAAEYEKIAAELGVDFMDAAAFVQMNKIDYMHLDAESHGRLAEHIAAYVQEALRR